VVWGKSLSRIKATSLLQQKAVEVRVDDVPNIELKGRKGRKVGEEKRGRDIVMDEGLSPKNRKDD